MPDPTDPDEYECRVCNDTGTVVGTYRPCTACRDQSEHSVSPTHPPFFHHQEGEHHE